MTFDKWFETFLEEKNLPFVEWEITNSKDEVHWINSDVVTEHIMIASSKEKAQIKDVIVKIDFANGDVNHFFRHLAVALTEQNV